jgi:alpha-tubulin suppressor-like RCC1 family protein
MAACPSSNHSLTDLPLELFSAVCEQLDLHDLVRVAETCKRFRHGDGGPETVELPTKSPIVAALRKHAFDRPELIPSTRPIGCSESWVAYLARCARQRRCREAPPIAAGRKHSLFVVGAGRLLTCGEGAAVGHGDAGADTFHATPVAALAGLRVRSVAAERAHSLVLSWDGRVFSWGKNDNGQLGQGDKLNRPLPTLVEVLEAVCSIGTTCDSCVAVTQSGDVFSWGQSFELSAPDLLRPVLVKGLMEGVRVRRVCVGSGSVFAIGENGEVSSWGYNGFGCLGHGDELVQDSPKRVEALRGVRVSSVAVARGHALALAEDGLVYAWGENFLGSLLGNSHVERDLLPKPVEALRGVRLNSIAAAHLRSYAVADTGELWTWGCNRDGDSPLGHAEQTNCPVPKPIESLRGVKVDAVAAGNQHTLAMADDGSVYVWGNVSAAESGALGIGPSSGVTRKNVRKPRRVPVLRVACGL